jgi:hypothetical protein
LKFSRPFLPQNSPQISLLMQKTSATDFPCFGQFMSAKKLFSELILRTELRCFLTHKRQKCVLDQKNSPNKGKENPQNPAKIGVVKSAIRTGKYPLHFD